MPDQTVELLFDFVSSAQHGTSDFLSETQTVGVSISKSVSNLFDVESTNSKWLMPFVEIGTEAGDDNFQIGA